MNLYGISALIAAIFCIYLGLFVYSKKRGSSTNKVFLFLNFAIGFWCLSTFTQNLPSLNRSLIPWSRIFYIGSSFVPALGLHFAFTIVKFKKSKLLLPIYIISVFFAILNFSALFLKEIPYVDHFSLTAGVLYPLFIIFIFVCLGHGFIYLLKDYKLSQGSKRLQLKYILFAWCAIAFIGLLAYFLQFYGLKITMPHDIFVIGYLSILAYAIVKHRLMDITVVITRTAIFALVYALVLGLPFVLSKLGRGGLVQVLGANWWLGPLVLMGALATSGPFVYVYLIRRAEAIILREQRSYQEALKEAAIGIARIRNSKKLLDLIAHTVTETAHISHSAIYLFDNTSNKFLLKAGRNLKKEQSVSLDRDSPLIAWLERNKEPLVYEEIKRKSEDSLDSIFKELEEQMRHLNATVILASLLDEKILDILVLGNKLSGRAYTLEDLNNFSIFVSEAALAIENALRYEGIEDQVRQRTKELVEVQKQLVQAEKLATVGTLAGGVAHEINNPLTAILTNVQMLLAATNMLDPDSKESLQLIEEATKRCRTIVQKLMAYAKRPLETADLSRLDVLDVVKKAASFLSYQLEQENIKIMIEAGQGSYLVEGNQNELEQVFTNIILNARDAVKKIRKDGNISINLSKNEKWIEIKIKDEGAGIPKELMPRIFDPFFTTKDVGKGLGLGLSICQAIVDKHRGSITAHSEVNKGSVFTVRLPAAEKESKSKIGV